MGRGDEMIGGEGMRWGGWGEVRGRAGCLELSGVVFNIGDE